MLKSNGFKRKNYNWLQSTRLKVSPLKPISTKKKHRIQIEGKETDVYDRVYEFHKWRCILTWRPVEAKILFTYPHLLPKWSYPKYRLLDNNIVLVADSELHEEVDKLMYQLRRELWIKELKRIIESWERLHLKLKEMYELSLV